MSKDRTTATITIVAVIAIIIMGVALVTAPPAAPVIVPTAAATTAPVPSAADGLAFLASNASAEGVQTTASGLQYLEVTEGTGAKPTAADTVTVNYEGTLIDGTIFDSSYARNQPISFPLNQVIAGWTEGLQLMSVGSTYMFYIPSELAYGAAGRPPVIPPSSVLIFKIELLGIPSQEDETATEAATVEAEATSVPEVTAEATADS